MASPSADNLLIGRYRILEVVGRGGMGIVYKAADELLGGRFVAVKEMIPHGSQAQGELDTISRKFEQEALLLARLSHPYLPSIYDHFSRDGRWYLVMEFIPGETLSQRLRSMPQRCLSLAETLDIANKLCEVLDYLHTRTSPIIFGDLKPDNIMLTPEGHLYLIDFGIARLFETDQIDDEKFITQGYSAPEQYKSTQISPRADIYSLGATLYQIVTGNHPAHAGDRLAPLQLGNQPGAAKMAVLIMSMIEPDEQKRPQNIKIVKEALQRIATQQTTKQNNALNSSSWGEGTSASVPAMPNTSSTNPTDFATSLPASITFLDIKFQLNHIDALAWSPDGTIVAAANQDEIHVYRWPFDEKKKFSKEKTVLLSRSRKWQLKKGPLNAAAVLAWSPDSRHLAVAAGAELFVLDVSSEKAPVLFGSHSYKVKTIVWSPDGRLIASASEGHPNELKIWQVGTKKNLQKYEAYELKAIAWSPDSAYLAIVFSGYDRTLAFGSTIIADNGVQIFEAKARKLIWKYFIDASSDISWSLNGTYLAICSADYTVHILDAKDGHRLRSLEGHRNAVSRVAFLDRGRLLVSLSERSDVLIWRTDTWAQVAAFNADPFFNFFSYPPPTGSSFYRSAINPSAALIAPYVEDGRVRVWSLDVDQLLTEPPKEVGIQYTNAKVVLVGDSGVGKSGLGLVLSGQPFEPTESTHARKVWTFERKEDLLPDGRREIRETLLWDLAGQPGYRVIHQLHLSEVTVALVVFDAHNETDPFAGIDHWVRALHTAQRVRGNASAMKMFLVMARIDRGGRSASRERIEELARKWGFEDYFETSAKEGIHVDALAGIIRMAINWEQLPKVTSTKLFLAIKEFLLAEKQAGRLLSTVTDLYSEFLKMWNPRGGQDFSAEFMTGIRLLESAGMIRQLSFGGIVLLQPELLDIYTSALVNAVKDEPDGLGNILEETARAGEFFIPSDQRIPDREREKLLLIAMIEDLLSYEIALREASDEGQYLVFPSESTRENPDLPDPENVTIAFNFEGPIRNIYATLAVRLSHSGFFAKKELWKNAITYHANAGGICGLWLKVIDEGKGELVLFFDDQASQDTRFNFEEYVRVHLERKALRESVKRRRIFRCEGCGFVAPDQLVRKRAERGFNWFTCPVCETKVSLRDYPGKFNAVASQISEMDRAADAQRSRAKAQTTIQGKQETDDFDVFLCYNLTDKQAVMQVGEQLKERGILPWLDEWELRPGFLEQPSLEQQIKQIKSAAVFVGKNGRGPWQDMEQQAFIRQFVKRQCPVIPVILPDTEREPELPPFLEGMTWVDFRQLDPDPIDQLVWGITGERRKR
jgi:small GTP-binding protein